MQHNYGTQTRERAQYMVGLPKQAKNGAAFSPATRLSRVDEQSERVSGHLAWPTLRNSGARAP